MQDLTYTIWFVDISSHFYRLYTFSQWSFPGLQFLRTSESRADAEMDALNTGQHEIRNQNELRSADPVQKRCFHIADLFRVGHNQN